jgi:hypothetical protein
VKENLLLLGAESLRNMIVCLDVVVDGGDKCYLVRLNSMHFHGSCKIGGRRYENSKV